MQGVRPWGRTCGRVAGEGGGVFPQHLRRVAPVLEVGHVRVVVAPFADGGLEELQLAVVEDVGQCRGDVAGGVARGDVLAVAAAAGGTGMGC